MNVDVFTAEIVRNAFASAALEMNRTLRRTAYNPLLYDVQDFGVGVVSADGLLWGEAPGQAVFVGALADTVRGGLAKLGPDGFAEGDVLIVNDPFLTGTHISDTTVYAPIFWRGELVAFANSTAHWADIGGKSPGGWCPDSTDVYQEGLCFTHQRLYAGGRRNDDLWELIESNVRYPATVRGDLEAQIAACRLGAARVQALYAKYGAETVDAAMAQTIARTDEATRRKVAEFPDGTWTETQEMDHDGVVKDGPRPRVCVTVTIDGDRVRVSFDGSSPATRGPINITAICARACVRVAVKALVAPLERTNEGHFLGIDFDLPPGLIVSAERPAPSDSYGYVATVVEELVFRALAQAVPERCPGGGYQLVGGFFFRVDPRDGEPFICIDPLGGGNGGQPRADGPTLMMFPNGDVPNAPVEVLETRYPDLRVERFVLRPEVAGAGRFRGGMGAERAYRVLGPGVYLQTVTENTRDPLGKGVAGGETGEGPEIVVRPGAPGEVRLTERVSFFGPLEPGDLVVARSAGGGGWGPPLERDPGQVARDVRDELVTAEEADAVYGVALEPGGGGWRVRPEETESLRARRRA